MLQRRMLRNRFSLAALAVCGAMLAGCGGDGNKKAVFDLSDPDPNAIPICSIISAAVNLATQEIETTISIQDPDQLAQNIGMEVSFDIITNTGTFGNDVTFAGSGNLVIGNTVFGVGYGNAAPVQSQFSISSSAPSQLTNDPNAVLRVTVVDELGGTSQCDLSFNLNLISEPMCALTGPVAGSLNTGAVTIDFTVSDSQGDPATASIFWSIGGGGLNPATLTSTSAGALGNTAGCNPANPGGAGITGIQTTQGGAPTAVTAMWDSAADGVGANALENVTLTIYTEDCTTNPPANGMFNPPCTVDIQVLNNGAATCAVTGPAAGSAQGGTGCVTIDYTVTDADSATVSSSFDWSTNGGTTWSLATACVGSANPQSAAPGVGSFMWDVPADIPVGSLPADVTVRITPDDLTGNPNLMSCTSGVFTLVPISEPSCTITAPAAGTCVDGFPAGTVDIVFNLNDAQGDPINFSVCVNGMPATLTATSNGVLAAYAPTNAAACAGASNQVTGANAGATTVTWDFTADGLGGMSCGAATVTVYPEDGTTAGAGPFSTCVLDFSVSNNGAPTCTVNSVTSSTVGFDLVDADSGMVACTFEYSVGGGAFVMATAGGASTNPQNFAPGAGLSWTWDAAGDLGGCSMNVVVRITVDDGVMLPNRPSTCSSAGSDLLCIPVLANCRAVNAIGAADAPTGVVPAVVPGTGGMAPPSGNISDVNFFAQNYWAFDYSGVNVGPFNTTVQLTDAGGNNVGNPVVLYSAGIDYSALMDGGVCTTADMFQVVLEGSLDGVLGDYAPAMTGVFQTTWASSSAAVTVSPAGLLTGATSNACSTIDWTIMSTDMLMGIVDPTCAAGSFVACVDEAGIDETTRGIWLPTGDIDGNYGGLPSGQPIAGVGSNGGFTWIVNTGVEGVGALAARSEYDETFIDEDNAADSMSIGGSTQPALGLPFAVNTTNPNETRWNDVDAFAGTSGIFDIASQTFTSIGSGATQVRYVNEELANGAACNIWVMNPCMPFNSFVCPAPPPAGGYQTIAGTADITIP